MKQYKTFAKENTPQVFDYNSSQLKESGHRIKGRFNKNNPEFHEYFNDLKFAGKLIKVINLTRKDMVDVWIK